ncbi:MAG TPA: hypothetical protein VN426_01390 [Syntrophomonadaceae bacterium]|nr:hypothetical protein [Syntrophomonadaceae bacterium]
MDSDTQARTVAQAYENESLCDRYTVLFKDGYALALSEHPEQTEGFSRWIMIDDYDACSLGHQVAFDELPENIQKYVLDQVNNDI